MWGCGAHLCGYPTVHILRQVGGHQVNRGGPHAVTAQGGIVLQAITGAILGRKRGTEGSEQGWQKRPWAKSHSSMLASALLTSPAHWTSMLRNGC